MENYIKTGDVRFVFHNFPLSGFLPGSNMGVGEPMPPIKALSLWPYHDRLFSAQRDGQPGFTIDRLVDYAQELSPDECVHGAIA
ncbi:MAG: hypothetical protein R3E79_26485 [Caldilineaceae bacterium]